MPIPTELRRQQLRQRSAITTALTANFLAAIWASKGDTTRANILRDIRDRFLADIIRTVKDGYLRLGDPSTCRSHSPAEAPARLSII